jgi:hypothetical protein
MLCEECPRGCGFPLAANKCFVLKQITALIEGGFVPPLDGLVLDGAIDARAAALAEAKDAASLADILKGLARHGSETQEGEAW